MSQRGMPEASLAARIDDTLHRFRGRSGVPLAIGAVVDAERGLRLDHFAGRTAGVIDGVSVDVGHGLGGKVMTVNRPIVVDDYLRSPTITHRYNAVIAAERVRAMAAAPVIVDRRVVAVIYGALRVAAPLGARTLDALTLEARTLEHEIIAARASVAADGAGDALRVRVTEAYAQLRALARSVDDAALAASITAITDDLLDGAAAAPAVELTGREQDVLTLAALGYSNPRIADELGIGVHTTKGYMKSVLRKLGASGRLEAVVIARRDGLLP